MIKSFSLEIISGEGESTLSKEISGISTVSKKVSTAREIASTAGEQEKLDDGSIRGTSPTING